MPSLTETALFLFLALVLLATVAGVGAWLGARMVQRRRERMAAEGSPTRGWGGRDHDRMRTKYFGKERRAREVRARYRRTREAQGVPHGAGDRAGAHGSDAPADLVADHPERRHRATLWLSGETDPQEIRRAYKMRVREYHPDQVARLGVKLRRLAEEETKRINEAYAYFRKRYGF